MGQEPEAIRREIEETRRDMDVTLDEIEDRVSPSRIAQRRTERVRTTLTGWKDQVVGSAERGGQAGDRAREGGQRLTDEVRHAPETVQRRTQGNPLAAGLIAFGAGLLAASLLPKTDAEQEAAQEITERLEPARQSLTEAGQQVAEAAKQSAQHAADEIKDSATRATDTVRDEAVEAADHVKQEGTMRAERVKEEGTDRAQHLKEEGTERAQHLRESSGR